MLKTTFWLIIMLNTGYKNGAAMEKIEFNNYDSCAYESSRLDKLSGVISTCVVDKPMRSYPNKIQRSDG